MVMPLSFLDDLDIEEIKNYSREKAAREAVGGEVALVAYVNPSLGDDHNVESNLIEAWDVMNIESRA
ncbi:conserved hypothetical protein [Ricinus communis]|uniref:Uncharacterized protein n=1 Tax=Ricinus communis TaxID=3988 RepID=B9SIQ6_RICCO|nr:conserved hypothetical protein [Ricinus communis]